MCYSGERTSKSNWQWHRLIFAYIRAYISAYAIYFVAFSSGLCHNIQHTYIYNIKSSLVRVRKRMINTAPRRTLAKMIFSSNYTRNLRREGDANGAIPGHCVNHFFFRHDFLFLFFCSAVWNGVVWPGLKESFETECTATRRPHSRRPARSSGRTIVYLRGEIKEAKNEKKRDTLEWGRLLSPHGLCILFTTRLCEYALSRPLFICTHNHLKPSAIDINMHNWYVAKMLLFAI